MQRKQYSEEALNSAMQFDSGGTSNIIFNRKLKLPIPRVGDTADGYSEVQVLFLPSPNDENSFNKNMVEVNILHKDTATFIGKYWISEAKKGDDLAIKTRWDFYNANGRHTNIRVSDKEAVKRFVNVYVISHPKPEEVGKLKLFCYGKKVSEIVAAAIKGSAVYDYEKPVNIMAWPLRIIIPEGVSPSGLYEKAKFIPADEAYVDSIYANLKEDDLVNLQDLVDGKLDTGNSINPPVEYIAGLLQSAGYVGNGADKKEVADLSSASGVSLQTPGLVDYSGFPDDEGFPN